MSWQVAVRMRLGALELDVDLRGEDEPVALIGPNGSGKTTLLRTIAGAFRPEAGVIRVGDEALFDAIGGIDLPPERRGVGYVPQGYGLFPHLSALDNVAFSGLSRGASRDERRRAANRGERRQSVQRRFPAADGRPVRRVRNDAPVSAPDRFDHNTRASGRGAPCDLALRQAAS